MKRKRNVEFTLWERIKHRIGDALYSVTWRLHAAVTRGKPPRQRKASSVRKREGIFVWLVLLFPLVQFCVFYIGVNVNSIVMAFQRYDIDSYSYVWAGWSNFRRIFTEFIPSSDFMVCLKNSVLSFVCVQIMSPLVLFFTFFIYKKFIGYRFFKIVLFLPTIISMLIMVTVYKFFCEVGAPYLAEHIFHVKIGGLLSDPKTSFGAVMFFYLMLNFGSLMLMYLGCMNGISESVVESAKLEGANAMQEFFYITFPMIYPTFSTLFFTSLAGIFTNQLNLYSLWGSAADQTLWTFGYYMYKEVVAAADTQVQYPYLAALGLLMTLVVAPLTFGCKWLLEKIGPSVE